MALLIAQHRLRVVRTSVAAGLSASPNPRIRHAEMERSAFGKVTWRF